MSANWCKNCKYHGTPTPKEDTPWSPGYCRKHNCFAGVTACNDYEPDLKIGRILKDCPFCGGEAEIRPTHCNQLEDDEGPYKARCTRCGAATTPRKTEEAAALAWEERTEVEDRELNEVIKQIKERYKNAKKTEYVRDPLGYAIYNTWTEREGQKKKSGGYK